ncbi:hypothetical protein BH20ACI1_BH20ACI1_09130 [soil metagenome]
MKQTNMTHTVVGLFDNKADAKAAMEALVKGGFIRESIDLSNRRITDTKTTKTTDYDDSVGDSIGDFFSSLFGTDSSDTSIYSDASAETEGILTVMTDSKEKAEKAADILDDNGAVDVNERANKYRARTGATTAKNKTASKGEMTIPVVEEQMNVGKRTVEQGGVRVRSRIIEKPVEEKVRLREEHIIVNRRDVDRAATESDFSKFKEGSIEITERAEKAVVGKTAKVVEEVVVGKNVTENQKTVSGTVKRTDVDVDEIKSKKARG